MNNNRFGKSLHGTIDGDTYRKRISGSKHIMNNPRGIFFDVDILQDLESQGVQRIEVTDTESSTVYTADLSLVFEKGIHKHYAGCTEQLGLAIREFETVSPLTYQSRATVGTVITPCNKRTAKQEQLSLFGLFGGQRNGR